jgi:ABC-type phosphate/phosphonate transport system substrate-binding protein
LLKTLLSSLTLVALLIPAAQAATVAKKSLVFAVSEGSSGGISAEAAHAKYQPLADAMGVALNAEVKVTFVREFSALANGMKENQFDLVLARPSDYPARGMRDNQYQFVATASPDGQCMLIVPKDSPVKKLSELTGEKFIFPEQSAYMTRFCRAELRDNGILLDNEKVHYVREQGAIPFAVENKIADVGGIASYSGAYKEWIKNGYRVLHQSKPQPYLPLVASRNLNPEQVGKLQKVLSELGNDDTGKQTLKRVGVTGFLTTEEARLRKLLEWLGV